MSTIFNLSTNLSNNVQNSLTSYNATFRNTVNINLCAMMSMTNLCEEQTGSVTDLVSFGGDGLSETDHLIRGILKITRAGINAGFLKLSTSGGSDTRHYLSFMIPYRPNACEIRLVAVAAVDVTNLLDSGLTGHTSDVFADAVIANTLYEEVFGCNNASYTAWLGELTAAFNNSLDIVDTFINCTSSTDEPCAQFV
jgi:hypothetical protein